MSQLRALFIVVAVLLLTSPASAADVPASESIAIQERDGAYEITTPSSRLVAIIPRGGLVLMMHATGAVENTRYFLLEDNTRHLTVSGWFEPAQAFPGVKEFWTQQTQHWRDQGTSDPQAVSFAKIGDWDAILYDMPLAAGTDSHLRAHYVQAGTWIGLNLSISTDLTTAENRATLERVLKAVQVRQKQ
jgi:hypothetical protein